MEDTVEVLAGFEELFAKRYTEEDAGYMKAVNSKTKLSPPCIENWLSSGYSRGGHRDDRRDRDWHGGGGRYGDRYHPYQRDDRHGGGRYGDRHGDRYGSDRYGNRPQDRRDDRRRHDHRDGRRKPTDHGSEGFYQFYY